MPSLESYTSSPLELRLELQLDIGSDHGYLDYEPRIFGLRTTDIWILRHHWITTPKDCLTGRNSIITGLIYRKTVSRSNAPGQCYIWIIREIFLEYVLETSHYWTLTDYTGH